MSIQDCIQTFFNHVESLDIADNHDNDGYSREFKSIISKQRKWQSESRYPATTGEKAANLVKNRYKDILPYEHSRVVLPAIEGVENSDYINANFINGVCGKKTYIASQGPQPATVHDFWRMLWHFRINVVIMACNEYEGIKLKCKRYWPDKDKELTFFNDTIKVTMVEEHDYAQYIVRILQVKCEDQTRLIYQLHYLAWPDHGIPTAIEPILDMLAYARQYQPSESVPIVVHCSAGCGRTGTVIALDYTWSLLKEGKLTLDYSIYDLILNFRTQRQSLVQSEEQYLFVYMAVKELFQRHLNLIEEHFYENVDIIRNAAAQQQQQEPAEEESAYQEVKVTTPEKPSRPVPANFNQNFPSPPPNNFNNIPDNERTPEVPKLLPVPLVRRNKSRNDNDNESNTSPRSGPPKPDRIFVTDSPTNTTIRNTLNRLYSSSSDTDSDMYANVGPPPVVSNDLSGAAARNAAARTTPNKLSLNSISEDKKPANKKPSPTTPKPRLTSDPAVSSSTTRPVIKTTKPKSPEKPPRDSEKKLSGGRDVRNLISSFDRAASLDGGSDVQPQTSPSSSSRQASLSDSSSVNTVFTSDKGSPSGTSDISVFGSENTPSPNSAAAKNSATAKNNGGPGGGKGGLRQQQRVDQVTSSSSNYELQKVFPSPPLATTSEYSLATHDAASVAKPTPNSSSPMDCSETAQFSSSTNNLQQQQQNQKHSPVDTRGGGGKCAIPEQPDSQTDSYEPIDFSQQRRNPPKTSSASVSKSDSFEYGGGRNERVYSDIADVELEAAGGGGGGEMEQGHTGTNEADSSTYAYADVEEKNKWSLQHIALHKPEPLPVNAASPKQVSSTYSDVTEEDDGAAEVFDSSSDDDDSGAPALPQKLYSAADVEDLKRGISKELVHRTKSDTTDAEASSVYVRPEVKFPQTGTLGRVFGKKLNFPKRKPVKAELAGAPNPTTPPVVQYKGKVISYGNRVVKPRGGRSNAFKSQ